MVKNPPAIQETWVPSLGQGDPLEKGITTHSSILAWRIPWTEEPGGVYNSWGHKKSDTTNWLTLSHSSIYLIYLPTCFLFVMCLSISQQPRPSTHRSIYPSVNQQSSYLSTDFLSPIYPSNLYICIICLFMYLSSHSCALSSPTIMLIYIYICIYFLYIYANRHTSSLQKPVLLLEHSWEENPYLVLKPEAPVRPSFRNTNSRVSCHIAPAASARGSVDLGKTWPQSRAGSWSFSPPLKSIGRGCGLALVPMHSAKRPELPRSSMPSRGWRGVVSHQGHHWKGSTVLGSLCTGLELKWI